MKRPSTSKRLRAAILSSLLLTAVPLLSPRAQAASSKLDVVKRFTVPRPRAGLIKGSDGNFYGTTEGGGTLGYGTIFRMSPDGTVTTIYNFRDTDGALPKAALLQTVSGDFYGTTSAGGAHGYGTIFHLSPLGVLTTLHSFNGTDGSAPTAALVLGSTDGKLYGTTLKGGTGGGGGEVLIGIGTVFSCGLDGTFTSLHSFSDAAGEGAYPFFALLEAPAGGTFYGATSTGGASTYTDGTIFSITTTGAFATVYNFTVNPAFANGDSTHAAYPSSALIRGADGNYYGTTTRGGELHGGSYNYGTIYRFTGTQVSIFYQFPGATQQPISDLLQDGSGNFYGISSDGFVYDYTDDNNEPVFSDVSAAFYEVSSTGHSVAAHVLSSSYDNSDFVPLGADLVRAADGTFYGTLPQGDREGSYATSSDHTYGNGVAFKITSNLQTYTVIHAFTDSAGRRPSELLHANDGNYYATTQSGGSQGVGTVVKYTPGGSLQVIYTFATTDGAYPLAGLVQASDGNLYGTTSQGGASGAGTIFQLTPQGVLTTLHSFSGADGNHPSTKLFQASNHLIYGTTDYSNGGTGTSTLFRITTAGAFTSLHTFQSGAPKGDFVQDARGYLYGVTTDFVYRISPGGSITRLFTFGNNEAPQSGLILATDGNFYGTTYSGGENKRGSVYRMTPAGKMTAIYSFQATNLGDSSWPCAGVIQASDGNLYGTTTYTYSDSQTYGNVFRLTLSGDNYTSLKNFTRLSAQDVRAPLLEAGSLVFYGSALGGGTADAEPIAVQSPVGAGYGTIIKLTVTP